MSQRSWVSIVALLSGVVGSACATSADPGFGGSTSDSGTHHDTTAGDSEPLSDAVEPGIDTSALKDSGTTKTDTGPTGSDTGSTGTDTGSTGFDTGSTGTDTGSTGFDTAPPPTDTAPPPTDTGTGGVGTTGNTCSSDLTCDPSATPINHCASTFFSLGPIYPSPVCVGYNPPECAADDGTTVVACDGTRGVCLKSGTNEICLPACSFDDTGAAPTGCVGKDVCNVFGFGHGASGAVGVGYCFGGCKADADCPTSSKCQIETGLCVTTKVTYTKSSGTACTKAADAGTTPTCNCLYGTTSSKGYCANYCTVGSTTCGTGYKCSPQLPTSDSTGPLFSKDPTGIAGNCLKTCTTTADCTAINSTCTTTATGKVCLPN